MADEPLGSRQPSDPLPGWPAAPADGPGRGPAGTGRPPSAPPPGWAGARPGWASTPSTGAPPPPPPSGRSGRSDGDRRGLLIGGLIALLLVAAVIGAVVISQRGDDGSATKQAAPPLGPIGSVGGPPAPLAPGKEAILLQGRLTVAARPGWEQLESSPDTASVKVFLREPSGRELLTTLIVTAIPGGGSLDSTLALPGGTGFGASTPVGPLKATAMPGTSGRVVAGIVRPRGTLFLSLSVFATDGKGVDAPLLRKLFTEQVVPALRFA